MTNPHLQNYDSKKLIQIGLLLCGISHLFMGPAVFLPNKLWIIGIGQYFVGTFSVLLLIPSLPEMIHIANQLYPHQKLESSDLSSGVFNSMLGLAQMIGPLFGSYMTSIFGFRTCGTSASVILLSFATIYFLIEFRKAPVKPQEVLLEFSDQKLMDDDQKSFENQG